MFNEIMLQIVIQANHVESTFNGLMVIISSDGAEASKMALRIGKMQLWRWKCSLGDFSAGRPTFERIMFVCFIIRVCLVLLVSGFSLDIS